MNCIYNQAIYYNRACANTKLGKYAEALADCDAAIALNA
jgi:DnaJ homolog subfamily C member 7